MIPIEDADSREETTRTTAVMSTGTLLSRGTGLVRVAVTLAALGTFADLRRLREGEHHPQHRLRAGARRHPHQRLRPAPRRLGARERRRGCVGGRQPVPDDRAGGPVGRDGDRDDLRAADHAVLPGRRGEPRRPAGRARDRHLLPAVVPAADRLLRDRRGRGGDADGEPPLRGADVRARAQQHRRDRDDGRVHRVAPRRRSHDRRASRPGSDSSWRRGPPSASSR